MTEEKGRGRNSEKRDSVSDWKGGGRWVTKELKTNMISVPSKRRHVFCLLQRAWQPVPEGRRSTAQ